MTGAMIGAMKGLDAAAKLKQKSTHWLDTSLARATYREAMAEAQAKGIVFDVEEGQNVGFSKQADMDLNTLEAFMKRRKIRRHPVVISSLEAWWKQALSFAQKARPGCDTLTFDDYRDIHRCGISRLLPEIILRSCPHPPPANHARRPRSHPWPQPPRPARPAGPPRRGLSSPLALYLALLQAFVRGAGGRGRVRRGGGGRGGA